MKIAGIVAEYNPFHNGHAYHIRAARDAGATHIVAVMSGDFTQRGEPAVTGKWVRARMALLGGADLILELPGAWSMSSAERFARGAVSLLHALGCVTLLSFGSESGDLPSLLQCARVLDSPTFSDSLKMHLAKGVSFPRARTLAALDCGLDAAPLSAANDTLGIEYLRALACLGSPIQPLAVRRLGAGHDAARESGGFASAFLLREHLRRGRMDDVRPHMPPDSFKVLWQAIQDGLAPSDLSLLERPVLTVLRGMSLQQMAALPDMTEGFHNRLYQMSRQADSLPGLYRLLKTKRYTHSRVRRACMSAFLGIPGTMAQQSPPYARVLGFNERGREILGCAKRTASVPLVTRSRDLLSLSGFAREVAELESHAADLFAFSLPRIAPAGQDLSHGIITL